MLIALRAWQLGGRPPLRDRRAAQVIGASLSWKAALIAASPPRRAGPDLGDPPPDAGPAYLWVVLRDSRGSVAFAGHAVGIAP